MRKTLFLIIGMVIVIALAACAPPSPAIQMQETMVADPVPHWTEPAKMEPVETPAKAMGDPGGQPEMKEASKEDQQGSLEPYLLVGTWSTKGNPGSGAIFPVDPSSGEPLPGYDPIPLLDHGYVHVFSQDGKRLAVIAFDGQSCDSFSGGTRCRGGRGELHLVDLPAWQVVPAALPVDGFVEALAFSPDTSRLALAASDRDGYDLAILDGYSGETIVQGSLDFPPELLAFTADGSSLVVYGTPLNEPAGMAEPEPPRAALLDAASLETRWEQELPEVTSGSWCLQNCENSHELVLFANYNPGKALSPDGQRLYLVHADEDRLTAVDFTAREVSTAAIAEEKSWFERLLALTAGVARAKGGMEGALKQAALSADGRVLYTAGQVMHASPDEEFGWHVDQESFPVQAIEVDTGRLLASFTLDRQGSYGLRLSPDGSYLVLEGWEEGQIWSEVLDAETLKPVAEVTGWQLQVIRRPDGALTWLGSRYGPSMTTLAVLDPEKFEPLLTWREYGYWLGP